MEWSMMARISQYSYVVLICLMYATTHVHIMVSIVKYVASVMRIMVMIICLNTI